MEKQIREASEKNSLLVESAREGILILEDKKIIYPDAHRVVSSLGDTLVLPGAEVRDQRLCLDPGNHLDVDLAF